MTDEAILTESLSREFHGRKFSRIALDSLTLSIARGEIHGLLGPNGAGKTTLCRILSTVLKPSSGTAYVMGFDVRSDYRRIRPLLGLCLGGERGLYAKLTASENLEYWGALYGLTRKEARVRAEELLERVGLSERTKDRIETFSRGMKQRVHLARSLVNRPSVLLLDEPTAGLDPVAAHDFRSLVTELNSNGALTILITTHDMGEAQALCDTVSLIDNGVLLLTDRTAAAVARFGDGETIRAQQVDDVVFRQLQALGEGFELAGRTFTAHTSSREQSRAVLQVLFSSEAEGIEVQQPTLEDLYLRVIGTRGMGTS